MLRLFLLCGSLSFTLNLSASANEVERPVNSKLLYNQAAFIPSQCYVKTQPDDQKTSVVSNPCYVCHTDSKAPNMMNDADTQLEFGFNQYARRNRWDNLFKDRSEAIKTISDDAMSAYVRESNYIKNGELLLAKALQSLPKTWDGNGNGKWDGYVPDSYFNFDEEGFDRTPQGEYTGWRAFVYVPFPGGFVPAAGSTDDVLIRLPELFWLDKNSQKTLAIYKLNLSIVESLIKQQDLTIPEVDEVVLGVDLDRNGKLNKTRLIKFESNAVDGSGMRYVGRAEQLRQEGKLQLAAGLYPKGTEFLHSVRYVDSKNGQVVLAERMKELRYAKKVGWASVPFHHQFAVAEAQERELFPEQIPQVVGDHETGVVNGLGWRFQGFIEDKAGALRPQNYEEHVFCVGCHSAIGALHDSTFAFGRKHNAYKDGWAYWSGQDQALSAIAFVIADQAVKANFLDYFSQVGAVTDFSVKDFSAQNVIGDLFPTESQIWQMNKAYKVIVEEQSFIYGRDASVTPMTDLVHRVIKPQQKTGIEKEKVSAF